MNELQIFTKEGFGEIRTVIYKDKPYFVGNDVAKMLEYARPSEAVTAHCKGTASYRILTNGGEQLMNIIPESDVYRLIIKAADQSRNPKIKDKAEEFESWVFDEVLPSIQKTGEYKSKRKTYLPPTKDKVLRQNINIADMFIKIGVKPGIAYATAIDVAERESEYSYDEYKKLLPAAEHETGFLNPTKIGEKLGLSSVTVNKKLEELALQYKQGKDWRLTESGKRHGEEFPYTRNGHSGYQIKWNESILTRFEQLA